MSLEDRRRLFLDWPAEIAIETYAKCNARCTFCPYTTLDRIGAKMPDEMMDRIIEELKDHPGVFAISPFKVNEPFLDKRLLPFCRKINAELPSAYIRLFSNGSALTGENIAGVAALDRVLHLWISLNDHRPDEYHALMGLDFTRTAANLDALHRAVEALDFTHPVVVSKVRAEAERNDADEGFVNYVLDRWPRFKPHLIKRDGWLGHVEPNDPTIPDTSCWRWFELSITATGKASLCCMDGEAAHAIGDLNEQSLFEIYNGKAYRALRHGLVSRKTKFPCSTCTY